MKKERLSELVVRFYAQALGASFVLLIFAPTIIVAVLAIVMMIAFFCLLIEENYKNKYKKG